MKHKDNLISVMVLIAIAGCSASIIYINKPEKSVDIQILQDSSLDTLDVEIFKPLLLKIKESVSVDPTDSIK